MVAASCASLPTDSWTCHVVTRDDGQIETFTCGHGPAVVLHPSLGRSADDFRQLARRLADAGFTAVCVNPREIGGSRDDTVTEQNRELTLHDCAADLWRLVDELGLDRVHLVGHAYGSRVVRCAAADRPERVRSITLLAAGGKEEGKAMPSLRRCFEPDLPEAEHLAAVQDAFFAPGNDASSWKSGWFPDAAKEQLAAVKRTKVDDYWLGGTAPLLVIQGLDDRIAPPANGRQLITERPGARLVEIAHAGHALLPEQPEAIAAALIEFLRANP